MDILKSITVLDYVTVACGVVCLILGIAQLCVKRCLGISNLKQYTESSIKSFAIVSSIIYLIGGVLLVIAPFVVSYINLQHYGFTLPTALPEWILVGTLLLVLIAQLTVLKKKL